MVRGHCCHLKHVFCHNPIIHIHRGGEIVLLISISIHVLEFVASIRIHWTGLACDSIQRIWKNNTSSLVKLILSFRWLSLHYATKHFISPLYPVKLSLSEVGVIFFTQSCSLESYTSILWELPFQQKTHTCMTLFSLYYIILNESRQTYTYTYLKCDLTG